MLNSHPTFSIGALSGGNSLATALSLNACPYLATSFFHYRPLFQDSIGATTILPQGVGWRFWLVLAEIGQQEAALSNRLCYLLICKRRFSIEFENEFSTDC